MAIDIGPKIGIDGEREFRKNLQQINQSLKVLKSESNAVASSFDDEADAQKKAAAQSDVLNRQILTQRDKLAELEKGLDASAKKYGESDKRTMQWQQAVYDATTELNKMERQLRETGDEVQDVGEDMGEAEEATSSWGDVMKGTLLADAVKAGVKALANAVKEVTAALTESVKEAAAYSDDIATMATKTGIAEDALQEYAYMADQVDVSLETVAGAHKKLTSAMAKVQKGNKEATAAFEALGVDALDPLTGQLRNADEVFADLINALGGIENETERDAAAMQFFGKSASDLNPLIEAGGDELKNLKQQAHDMGYVMKKDALQALNRTQDAMDKLNRRSETISRTFAQKLAPSVGPALEKLDDVLGSPRVQRAIELAADATAQLVAGLIDLGTKALPGALRFLGLFDTDLRVLSDDEIALQGRIRDTVKEQQAMNDAFSASAGSILGEKARAEELWAALQNVVDANGKVKEGQEKRAAYITGELSQAIGQEIELNDGVIQSYDKIREGIQQTIDTRTAEALLAAKQDEYTNAMLNRQQASENLAEASLDLQNRTQALADAQKAYDDYMASGEYEAAMDGSLQQRAEASGKLQELVQNINDEKAAVESSQAAYEQAGAALDEYVADIATYQAAQEALYDGDAQAAIDAFTRKDEAAQASLDTTKRLSEEEVQDLKNKDAIKVKEIEEYRKRYIAGIDGYTQPGLDELINEHRQYQAVLKSQESEASSSGKKMGSNLAGGMVTGLEGGKEPLNQKLDEIGQNMKDAGERIANNMIDGVLLGFANRGDLVGDSWAKVMSRGYNRGNKAIEAHSPSRKTEWTADMMIAGYVRAMDRRGYLVAEAVRGVMADALEAMRGPAMEMQGNLAAAAVGAGSSGGTSSYTHNYGGFTVNVYSYQGEDVRGLAAQVAQELNRQIMRAQRAGGY